MGVLVKLFSQSLHSSKIRKKKTKPPVVTLAVVVFLIKKYLIYRNSSSTKHTSHPHWHSCLQSTSEKLFRFNFIDLVIIKLHYITLGKYFYVFIIILTLASRQVQVEIYLEFVLWENKTCLAVKIRPLSSQGKIYGVTCKSGNADTSSINLAHLAR